MFLAILLLLTIISLVLKYYNLEFDYFIYYLMHKNKLDN